VLFRHAKIWHSSSRVMTGHSVLLLRPGSVLFASNRANPV